MTHRDWMEHCLQLGRAQLKAYEDASRELRSRIMTERETARLQWLVAEQNQTLIALKLGRELTGERAAVAEYLQTYADLHVRFWVGNGDAVRAGMIEARQKLMQSLREARKGNNHVD